MNDDEDAIKAMRVAEDALDESDLACLPETGLDAFRAARDDVCAKIKQLEGE